MKIIDSNEFYARYPQYSNIESLKKADILIMPNLDGSFPIEQMIFKNSSFSTGINLQFYSKDPKNPICRLRESADLNDFIYFGKIVVSYLPTIILILKYLQERKKENEIPDKNIIINFFITINSEKLIEFPYNEKIDNTEEKIKQVEFELNSNQEKNKK